MKILMNLFILVFFIAPIRLLADDAPFIKALFYENSNFKGHWGIEIDRMGNLVAEAENNMLDTKGKKEKVASQINKDDLRSLCMFIKENGFFKINADYSTSKIFMIDGPVVRLVISCGQTSKSVFYYPNSGDTADKTSQKIEAIWQKIWSYSSVKAPSLTKYM